MTTKIAHNINLSVFCKEQEDPIKIADALIALVPFNLTKEKIHLKKTGASGATDKKIIIFEIIMEKQRHIKQFLPHLNSLFSEEQCNLILSQKESRMDKDLNFFIRIDKPGWIKDRTAKVTDDGNCFHIRMTIAAFPAKQENGLVVVDSLFS